MLRKLLKTCYRLLLRIAIASACLSIVVVVLFKYIPVPITPLMVIRSVQQVRADNKISFHHKWVPLKKISSHMQLAVICSEDQKFPNHYGFDFSAIKRALKSNLTDDRKLRGGSTISQQTAKNVFLWPNRSWLRKGLEVWFTGLIEFIWGKERILEVYLNSIETGDGIYGIEAASRLYFTTGASNLTRKQSATIAAILPNPLHYSVTAPGSYVKSQTGWILRQMQVFGPLKLKK